jgi:hypothetical protein
MRAKKGLTVWLAENPTITYSMLGGLFGLTFPIVALFINALEMGLTLGDGIGQRSEEHTSDQSP